MRCHADWGRVGAIDSLFNPATVQICKETGMCCSDLQEADLPANFDYGDILGALHMAGSALA